MILILRPLDRPDLDAFELRPQQSIIVGRQTGADVVLNDRLLARRHARFSWTADGFTVEDAGSPAGTWLNDEHVRRPTPIKPGDRIRLGGLTLLVEVREDDSDGPA